MSHLVQWYTWVSESKLTVRYVYWHVLSRSIYCSWDVIDWTSADANLHVLIVKTNHCKGRSRKWWDLRWFHVTWRMSTSCKTISCASFLTSVTHWQAPAKPAVFYEKMRGACFLPSFSLVTLDTHTSQSHDHSLTPLPFLSPSPDFEVARECSANSWPQENKMSFESALCQIG